MHQISEFFWGGQNGVLNVINGNKFIVDEIPKQKISVSFVGSTDVAKIIYQTSAKYGKSSGTWRC